MRRRTEGLSIGTRGSHLALAQTDAVTASLAAARPGLEIRRTIIRTVGDRVLDAPLSQIGDKGLFTKDLETALLDGRIDLAVHSLKDLPTKIPEGLALGAILEREDPADVLVSRSGKRLAELPAGARIGTSSLRRRSQILALRPDLQVIDLRGNVPTRLEKAARGELDAIVLARAGLLRLGMENRATERLGPETLLPAVGQGAIGVEIRAGDARVAALLAPIDHAPTRLAVTAERALLASLEGGCQVPIGALARIESGRLTLQGLVAELDGGRVYRAEGEGPAGSEAEAAAIGERLAERLLAMGARAVLNRIFAEFRSVPQPAPSGGEAAE